MYKKATLVILFAVLSINLSTAQSVDNLKAINTTWDKFCKAFATLDYTLMADIHAKDLVRVSGGRRVIDYDTYINNYKASFERDKKAGNTSNISLRFQPSSNWGCHAENTASERGVYKLIRNKGTEKEQTYYGQFHVLFKKIDGEWQITMDYDSSEGGTIGEDAYNKAHAIDDFEKFSN